MIDLNSVQTIDFVAFEELVLPRQKEMRFIFKEVLVELG